MIENYEEVLYTLNYRKLFHVHMMKREITINKVLWS
jgi:hypothetical protein